MKLVFSRNAVKFLEKIPSKDSEKVKNKIFYLLDLAQISNLTTSKEIDIKPLKGSWAGFSRLRIGKIRVVFEIDVEQDELLIYAIDFRGDVY